MSGKRLSPLFQEQKGSSPSTQDYHGAQSYGPIALSDDFLYWNKAFAAYYVPAKEIDRAYLREEGGSASICCGRASFSDYYLVLRHHSGNSAKIPMGHQETVKSVLAQLGQHSSGIAIGFREAQPGA